MRGSKAKLLRQLAGGKKSDKQSYAHIPHTVRTKKHNDVLGNTVRQAMTATLIIDPEKDTAARSLYKTLKQGYKLGAMRYS